MRVAAKGLPVVVVNPTFVLGPDDPTGTSNGLVRRLLLRRIPAYIDGGAQHRRRPRRRPRATCSPTSAATRASATCSRRATSPCSASSPTSAGSPACRRRRVKLHGQADAGERSRRSSGPGCRPRPPRTRSARGCSGGPTATTRRSRELGFDPRPHEETLEDTVAWQLEQLGDRARGPPAHRRRPARARARRCQSRPSVRQVDRRPPAQEPRRVLYRCRTPTNFLCPCGAVARAPEEAGARAPHRAGRPTAAGRPPRDRRAHQAGPRARAGRRRRGDPRLEANPQYLLEVRRSDDPALYNG